MKTQSPISLAGTDPIFQDRAAKAARPWSPSVVGECAEVLSNDSVNLEYRHLVVRCGAVAASAVPGQFFQLLCPHTDGAQPFLRRPMSLYGIDPARLEVEFLYKIVGAGTRGLATLRAGDTIDIMGPLGVPSRSTRNFAISSRSGAAPVWRRLPRLHRLRRPMAPR
jgi:dihydroorotate dehydrogenase electron transfer subunit